MRDPEDEREAAESVALLRERALRVPEEVTRALAGEYPGFPLPRGAHTRFVTCGLGASEGVARFLASVLAGLGFPAYFAPVGAFLAESPPAGDVLVTISQGLSPNARIPLRARPAFAQTVLLTALDPMQDARIRALAESGVRVIVHGPAEEGRLLLRVMGPAVAAVIALRAAAASTAPVWGPSLASLPGAIAAAFARGRDDAASIDLLSSKVALVCACGSTESIALARGKLVEGLGLSDPPIWDACGLAHGPFQAFYERPATFLVLGRARDRGTSLLTSRFSQALAPERHRVWRHEAHLPGPLAVLEHDAAILGLVVGTLERAPRNLIRWPAQGKDAPIYDLDERG